LQGRKRGEDLNERVMIWSIFVTIAIFCVGFAQVENLFIGLGLGSVIFYSVELCSPDPWDQGFGSAFIYCGSESGFFSNCGSISG
jgi:hypothetical protein